MQERKPLNPGQRERVHAHVEDFLEGWQYDLGDDFAQLVERTDNWQHIVDCGTSILLHKWGYGPPGGSFVEAVAGNDLMGAFGRADWVNVRAIRFYCTLIHNTGLIE